MTGQSSNNNQKRPARGPAKYIFAAAGLLALGIGAVGVVLPFLPSTPFFILTLICFAKGSDRLHRWFLSTKLYKKHLENYVKHRTMTKKTKISVVCSVTLLMGFGAFMMRNVPAGLITLGAVWLFHVLYFIFRVRTSDGKITVKSEK